jgi:hypothetical protein
MKKELAEQFNQEVDRYRNALLYEARKSDWEAFDARAGKLFDYVESIEFSELERRFLTVFTPILAVLGLVALALLGVDVQAHPELMRLKNTVILAGLAASSFELYFFIDYRIYMRIKTSYYKRRRENFIRNMELDFRAYTLRPANQMAQQKQ